jgi:hypothetical protein
MKKLFGIIFTSFLLVSCASTPDDYMNMNARNLCIGWYERLGGNIHAKPMGIAIDKRGIDCNQYMDAMQAAKKSRDEFYDGLKDNLDHLGSGSKTKVKQKPVNCTTRKVGGYVRTYCY